MFFGYAGLICDSDGDQGDACQREGMYGFLGPEILKEDVTTALGLLETAPGVYVRSPDPIKWYSNPKTTSRDQLIPIIWACGKYKEYARLRRLFWSCLKRGMFAQNTEEKDGSKKIPDTMLACIPYFIRCSPPYVSAILYSVLVVFDLLDCIESAIWAMTPRGPDDVDDNNRVICHLGAALNRPTPFSWLSRQIYARWRPNCNGPQEEKNRVMRALMEYHAAFTGGNPDFIELFRPFVEKYMKAAND